MSLCTVSGTVVDSGGNAVSSVPVTFNIQNPTVTYDPTEGSTATASDGTWSMSVGQGLSGVFTFQITPDTTSRAVYYRYNVNIPSSTSATFASTVVD